MDRGPGAVIITAGAWPKTASGRSY